MCLKLFPVFLSLFLSLLGCGALPTPSPVHTVQPTAAPVVQDLEATVEALVSAQLAAVPTVTSVPTPTPLPERVLVPTLMPTPTPARTSKATALPTPTPVPTATATATATSPPTPTPLPTTTAAPQPTATATAGPTALPFSTVAASPPASFGLGVTREEVEANFVKIGFDFTSNNEDLSVGARVGVGMVQLQGPPDNLESAGLMLSFPTDIVNGNTRPVKVAIGAYLFFLREVLPEWPAAEDWVTQSLIDLAGAGEASTTFGGHTLRLKDNRLSSLKGIYLIVKPVGGG